MTNQLFIHANEVAVALVVSKAYAYKVVRDLNKELKEKGFITIAGKVNRTYCELTSEEGLDASIQRQKQRHLVCVFLL